MSLPFQKFCFTWKILWAMLRILGIGLKCRPWYLVGDCFVWLSGKPQLQQSQRLEKTWQMLRASQQHSTEWNRLYWQCWHRGLFSSFHLALSHMSEEHEGAVPFHMLENTQWKLVFPSHNVNQRHFDSWETKGRLLRHLESEMIKKGIIKIC